MTTYYGVDQSQQRNPFYPFWQKSNDIFSANTFTEDDDTLLRDTIKDEVTDL
jgi:hypothetical protein